jgi:hypothetical protein
MHPIRAAGRIALLGGAALLAPHRANADDAVRSSDPLPVMSLDLGIGLTQPTLGSTNFGSVGQTQVTGVMVGVNHPSGFLFYSTLHLFPFHLRNFGIATVTEVATLSPDAAVSPLVGSSVSYEGGGPSYFSLLVGPEAQARFGSFLMRGSLLAGTRITTAGDYTATDWRIATHAQLDYIWGSGFSVGVLGGVDMFPALGFSAGVSLSLAMF